MIFRMSTLSQNVKQAIHDFDAIKDAIEYQGVDVPAGTPTSGYEQKNKRNSNRYNSYWHS